jgi:sugar lactone lactonase YvrE
VQNNKKRRPGKLAGALAVACVSVGVAGVAQAALQLNFQNLGGGATGDGGQAKLANLNGLTDVVFDAAGNLYVSQYFGNRIRKITPAGVISTVVGGNTGFGGDGGPASNALIDRPGGMAFDASGNLYFADTGNRRIRRIAPNGTITTVAGNGMQLHAGDGGQALKASFVGVNDLAVDKNGNVFASDTGANRIRKITPAGVISTYAGTGDWSFGGDGGPATAAALWAPTGIDTDAAGNLFIADGMNGRVRRVATNGTITTFIDVHEYFSPHSVQVDKSGNVFMSMDCRVNKYNSAGVLQLTYDGFSLNCERAPEGAPATSAGFGYVEGVALDSAGNVYFTDGDYNRVAKVTIADNKLWTHAGVSSEFPDGTSAASAPMMSMGSVTVTDSGTLVVADRGARRVRTIVGGKVYAFAGKGSFNPGCATSCASALSWGMPAVAGLAAGPGNVVYVSDPSGGVFRVAPDKSAQIVVERNRDGAIPRGIGTDLAGNLYIADYNYRRIRKFDTAGVLTTIAGTGMTGEPVEGGLAIDAIINRPTALALDAGGAIYLYDSALPSIRKIGRDGKIRRIAGNGAVGPFAGEGGLAVSSVVGSVGGIAVHPSGVYFSSDGKLRRVRPDARIETIAFPYFATGLSIKFGYLYITTQNGRVQRALLPRAAATADYDGDGRSDVLFRGTTGANLVWLGANSATKQLVATMATEQKLAGQGDFDGDGEVDLVWRNTLTGENRIWRSANVNTQMVLTSVADQNWTIAGVGDFNGDGRADLFWRNKLTGANEYWPGAAASAKKAVASQLDLHWIVAGIGDFDGDGRSDALWRNTQTGANQAWPGLLASQASTITPLQANWKVAAIGDVNGDGASDIVWRDDATGASAIWRSGNSAWRQSIAAITNPQWSIAAAADYDNDGMDDLLWRNNVTGANVIWKNAKNTTQKAVASAGSAWKVQPVNAQP